MLESLDVVELFVELLGAVTAPVVAVFTWLAQLVKLVLLVVMLVVASIWTLITGDGVIGFIAHRKDAMAFLMMIAILSTIVVMPLYVAWDTRQHRRNMARWEAERAARCAAAAEAEA